MLYVRQHLRLVWTLAAVLFAANPLLVSHLSAQLGGPDLNGAAKLMSFTGQISWIRGNDLWALRLGDVIQPQQVYRDRYRRVRTLSGLGRQHF